MNKSKIINDPVYGFISIQSELLFSIVEHQWFQRLRRIKQLGVTDFVYPGALHTRFHHALGAMHLMGIALNTLKAKGHKITAGEFESAQAAALLHDIGHGPFSHALEGVLLPGVSHETLTMVAMKLLNDQFKGKLKSAMQMFEGSYHRPFFHQLISGQLDVDRLDYLNRDSFYTGVMEGAIGVERILHMLDLYEEELVVEEKGIYSIESFLTARRIMYWQVYMHKTSISMEQMLIGIIERAKQQISKRNIEDGDEELIHLMRMGNSGKDSMEKIFLKFVQVDDNNLVYSIKKWAKSEDRILNYLCSSFLNRKLQKVILTNTPVTNGNLNKLKNELLIQFELNNPEDLKYLLKTGYKTNSGYAGKMNRIKILKKNGKVDDIANASDLPGIKALSKVVKKYYVWMPKNLSL